MSYYYTPWGAPDHSKQIADGIVWHGTPSHGGFELSAHRQGEMPDALRLGERDATGWYEEDCDWARVVCAFPDLFPEKERNIALDALREWAPDAYEHITRTTLAPGESYLRDKQTFAHEHAHDWVVVSAFGDWSPGVPAGHVGVCAEMVGRLEPPVAKKSERYFLVPETEYATRGRLPFVIDPARHQECGYEGGRFVPAKTCAPSNGSGEDDLSPGAG